MNWLQNEQISENKKLIVYRLVSDTITLNLSNRRSADKISIPV